MWIRSQNKKFLGDYKEIIVAGKDILEYSIPDYPKCLGTYSSESRALEVLDLIQRQIMMCTHHDIISAISGNERISKAFVFQMPKE